MATQCHKCHSYSNNFTRYPFPGLTHMPGWQQQHQYVLINSIHYVSQSNVILALIGFVAKAEKARCGESLLLKCKCGTNRYDTIFFCITHISPKVIWNTVQFSLDHENEKWWKMNESSLLQKQQQESFCTLSSQPFLQSPVFPLLRGLCKLNTHPST